MYFQLQNKQTIYNVPFNTVPENKGYKVNILYLQVLEIRKNDIWISKY